MYKANREIHIGDNRFIEGSEIPDNLITSRMIEMGMVEFVFEETQEIEEKPKKRGRKKKDELLVDDSSNVSGEIEDTENTENTENTDNSTEDKDVDNTNTEKTE